MARIEELYGEQSYKKAGMSRKTEKHAASIPNEDNGEFCWCLRC